MVPGTAEEVLVTSSYDGSIAVWTAAPRRDSSFATHCEGRIEGAHNAASRGGGPGPMSKGHFLLSKAGLAGLDACDPEVRRERERESARCDHATTERTCGPASECICI